MNCSLLNNLNLRLDRTKWLNFIKLNQLNCVNSLIRTDFCTYTYDKRQKKNGQAWNELVALNYFWVVSTCCFEYFFSYTIKNRNNFINCIAKEVSLRIYYIANGKNFNTSKPLFFYHILTIEWDFQLQPKIKLIFYKNY